MKKKFIYLMFTAVSLLSALACTTIINDPDDIDGNGIHAPIGGISILICIFSTFRFFIETPSYATYIKEKNDFFSRMKYPRYKSLSKQ